MLTAIRAGLLSRSEAISAFGYDAEDIDREIAADNAPRGCAGIWSSTPTRGTTRPPRASSRPQHRRKTNRTTDMQLVHLASRLYGTPLLIARSKLDVILSVLGPRIGLLESEAKAALPPARSAAASVAPAGIAVIPVHGTLVRRSMGLDAASGLTSYGEIGARLDAALADPQVAGILLDIDSPGGEAGGVFELAERIRAANAIKPVWAHANDSAYSAAYAIAARRHRA